MILIKCGQCGEMCPEVDIYVNDLGSIKCGTCLGFVKRFGDLSFPLDEVMIAPKDEELTMEGDG